MRRRAQQAADDLVPVQRDDEGWVESVQARLDLEPAEQPEREIVLGLVGGEERAGKREELVGGLQPGASP